MEDPDFSRKGIRDPNLRHGHDGPPQLGAFKRLGMDVVVNAVWLAYYWAKTKKDAEAVSALRALILDWPMDFILITGDSPEEIEEKKFTWQVNMQAKTERLRSFVGLENTNLLRIIMKAAEILKTKAGNIKKPAAPQVLAWLKENIKWGVFHCPDLATVERHLGNWAALQRCPRALQLVESAVQRWGRENLLDWPTKVGIIISKTDSGNLLYVMEALYTQMWRKNTKDPYGAAELKSVVPQLLWTRTYLKVLVKRYADLLKTSPSDKVLNEILACVSNFLESPLSLFLKTEGPDRDPTWLQALPTEALRLFMKHVVDLAQGLYLMEIKGALSATGADKYSLDKFHAASRVHQRFTEAFLVAYDSLTGVAQEAEAAKAAAAQGPPATKAESAGAPAGKAEEKKAGPVAKVDLSQFRQECEKSCRRELDARVVTVLASGTHAEINANVTSTRLYQNLTENAPCMGFYDVKNAKLCNIYDGEGLTHREPLIDEADFERFLNAVEPLLCPGRDVVWVLAGRTDSNLPKLKKIIGKFKLHLEVFYLCYNTKQMQQYGHWQRQRGLANSKSLEQAWYLYKGRVPKTMPKFRQNVDAGSPLFNQVVRNVPVLAPKHHAYVSKAVRQTSLATMTGVPQCDDPAEKAKLQSQSSDDGPGLHQPAVTLPPPEAAVDAVKKRKLYRQASGQEAQWFPHDNDPELLRECCWEAGRPRWVFHGTPAGGAGIHGCLEAGASVVALCYDEHHETNLQKACLERAVEAMVSGTTLVFKDEDLQARSAELNLFKPEKAAKKRAPPESEDDKKTTPKKAKKTKTKKKKAKTPKTKKAKAADASDKEGSSGGSSSSSEPSSSSESVPRKPSPKKAKK